MSKKLIWLQEEVPDVKPLNWLPCVLRVAVESADMARITNKWKAKWAGKKLKDKGDK